MMISPEMYVETEIKGKSKEEMIKKIRGLKQEIGSKQSTIGYQPDEWKKWS